MLVTFTLYVVVVVGYTMCGPGPLRLLLQFHVSGPVLPVVFVVIVALAPAHMDGVEETSKFAGENWNTSAAIVIGALRQPFPSTAFTVHVVAELVYTVYAFPVPRFGDQL